MAETREFCLMPFPRAPRRAATKKHKKELFLGDVLWYVDVLPIAREGDYLPSPCAQRKIATKIAPKYCRERWIC